LEIRPDIRYPACTGYPAGQISGKISTGIRCIPSTDVEKYVEPRDIRDAIDGHHLECSASLENNYLERWTA
jgi:hypothetical protein